MSQFDDDDDFDIDTEGGISQIRKALRAAEKRAKALEQELASFRAESRTRALKGAIEARGLNPKVAGIIPADIEDVNAWLDEYGDIFGAAPAQSAQATEPDAVPAPEGADTFSQVASTGTAPTGDEGQLMALLQSATTKDELDKLIFGKSL